jgi:predicted outer membrane repeat protein
MEFQKTHGARAFGLVISLLFGQAAWSAEYIVTNTESLGTGSLYEALQMANEAAGPDTIRFDSVLFSSPQRIDVSRDLIVRDDVVIEGPGSELLSLVATPQRYGLLSIGLRDGPEVTATVQGLTLEGMPGGNNKVLTTIQRARATLSDIRYASNGFFFPNNSGSAISIFDAEVSIDDCVVEGFSSTYRGGAVLIGSIYGGRFDVTIRRSVLRGNEVVQSGEAVLGKEGAAIYAYTPGNASTASRLTIIDSELSDNVTHQDSGGALATHGAVHLSISNSTISGNRAGGDGGAIATHNDTVIGTTISVDTSTITANRASGYSGGIHVGGTGLQSLSVTNSVVGANETELPQSASSQDIVVPIEVTAAYSHIGDSALANSNVNIVSGGSPMDSNIIGEDPLLGPLSENGGPTRTHAILSGSPLLDAASPGVHPRDNNLPLPSADQRGPGYARSSGVASDIGAYEFQVVPPTPAGQSSGGGGAISLWFALFLVLARYGRTRSRVIASSDGRCTADHDASQVVARGRRCRARATHGVRLRRAAQAGA